MYSAVVTARNNEKDEGERAQEAKVVDAKVFLKTRVSLFRWWLLAEIDLLSQTIYIYAAHEKV